ncbi:hypothetical protein OX88_21590 [Pseudomonas coronafaciens pv. porri]|uniref:hypothetical protein n=1 Tax=Pseudomonas coronafaciens TaxID=53409 RepID=UPI0006AB873E|nr:hypothetical protein [Pseudomonas coronafaciens]KOP53083.1 hypothetical protein OX88_21590 [Pseudomonas coronafaciens pv. porri]
MKIIDTTKTKSMSFTVIALAAIASSILSTILFMTSSLTLETQVILYAVVMGYYVALSLGLSKVKTKDLPEQLELAF